MERLLASGADVNWRTPNRLTPVFYASGLDEPRPHSRIDPRSDTLIKVDRYAAEKKAFERGSFVGTSGSARIVELLIEHKADVNQASIEFEQADNVDKWQFRPLDVAALFSSFSVAERLVRAGADPFRKGIKMRSPYEVFVEPRCMWGAENELTRIVHCMHDSMTQTLEQTLKAMNEEIRQIVLQYLFGTVRNSVKVLRGIWSLGSRYPKS